MRHVNHRGWIVLESITSDDGARCVDIFEDPSGAFGFEHFRSDPEDGGRWTAIGGFSTTKYTSPQEARAAAYRAIPWIDQH